jgi:hypothetical protein
MVYSKLKAESTVTQNKTVLALRTQARREKFSKILIKFSYRELNRWCRSRPGWWRRSWPPLVRQRQGLPVRTRGQLPVKCSYSLPVTDNCIFSFNRNVL